MREEDLIRNLRQHQPVLPEGFEVRRDALLQHLIQEEETVTKKKLSLSLSLALALALALIGVAIAASLGVFGQLSDNDYNKDKLEKLETLSQSYQQAIPIPATAHHPEAVFNLEQGYYDGESLYISYAMTDMASSGKLLEGKPDETALKAYEDYGDLDSNADWMKQALGEGFWQEVEKKIAKDGFAHVEMYSRYMGDGIYMEDGTYINPSASDYKENEDGSAIGYTEYERPLPDAARNKDGLDLLMKVYSATNQFYMTKDKVLSQGERVEDNLPIHIKRAEEAPVFLIGSGSFPGYSAEIRAKVSPVEIKADITLSKLGEQLAAWYEPDMDKADETWDILRSYQLYADGKPARNIEYQASITDDQLLIAMGFLRPETFTELTLIPVYSQSGEKKAEAITLK